MEEQEKAAAKFIQEFHNRFPGMKIIIVMVRDGSGAVKLQSNQPPGIAENMLMEIGKHLHIVVQTDNKLRRLK